MQTLARRILRPRSHAQSGIGPPPKWSFRQHRHLRLAPPFLLDDYTPRYQLLSSVNAAKKRSSAYAHLKNCNLCPRLCGVNRYERTGYCLIGEKVKVSVIAPHFGEGELNCLLITLSHVSRVTERGW